MKKQFVYTTGMTILFTIALLLGVQLSTTAYATETPVKPICGDTITGVKLPGCDTAVTTNTVRDNYLPAAINGSVLFVGMAAIVTLMISGIMYLTSLGNEEKTKKALKMIYYSIIGIVIAVFSYLIIQLVVNLQIH